MKKTTTVGERIRTARNESPYLELPEFPGMRFDTDQIKSVSVDCVDAAVSLKNWCVTIHLSEDENGPSCRTTAMTKQEVSKAQVEILMKIHDVRGTLLD